MARAQIADQRPPLSTYESFVYDSFHMLASERPSSMGGLSLIPRHAMISLTREAMMKRDMAESFIVELQVIDRLYTSRTNERLASQR